jgi:hypothetical protein
MTIRQTLTTWQTCPQPTSALVFSSFRPYYSWQICDNSLHGGIRVGKLSLKMMKEWI